MIVAGRSFFLRKAPHLTLSPRKRGVRPVCRLTLCPDQDKPTEPQRLLVFSPGKECKSSQGFGFHSLLLLISGDCHAPSVEGTTPRAEAPWSGQSLGSGFALHETAPVSRTRDNTRKIGAARVVILFPQQFTLTSPSLSPPSGIARALAPRRPRATVKHVLAQPPQPPARPRRTQPAEITAG